MDTLPAAAASARRTTYRQSNSTLRPGTSAFHHQCFSGVALLPTDICLGCAASMVPSCCLPHVCARMCSADGSRPAPPLPHQLSHTAESHTHGLANPCWLLAGLQLARTCARSTASAQHHRVLHSGSYCTHGLQRPSFLAQLAVEHVWPHAAAVRAGSDCTHLAHSQLHLVRAGRCLGLPDCNLQLSLQAPRLHLELVRGLQAAKPPCGSLADYRAVQGPPAV